jgi:hypothetical protein
VGSAQSITIGNQTPAPITWTSSLDKPYYVIEPANGTVPAGGNVSVAVRPLAIPQTSPTTPDHFGATLTVTTSAAGDSPHAVDLHMTARGAIFAWNPTSWTFPSLPIGSIQTTTFELANSGNAAASMNVVITGSTDFTRTPPTVTVNGASSTGVTVIFQPKAPSGPKSAQMTLMSAAGNATPLCAPAPTAALSGTAGGAVPAGTE